MRDILKQKRGQAISLKRIGRVGSKTSTLGSPDPIPRLRELCLDLEPFFFLELSSHELVASCVVVPADLDKSWIDHDFMSLSIASVSE